LVGKPPFGDLPESHRVKAEAHCQRMPAPLQAARVDVLPALESLVDRMLAKHPDDRPSSAAEVAVALGRLNTGHDLTALLERCGHQISDTRRIPRTQLSTLISRRFPRGPMSRRSLLIAGAGCALGAGGLTAWIWPRWSAASPLKANPQQATLLQRREGDVVQVAADGGFDLTAGDKLALLPLAQLPAGRYRLSTTITLAETTTRAGLYFDYGDSNSPAAHRAAQSLEFELNQRQNYGLVWRRILFHPDKPIDTPQASFGEYMPGQPLALEVEWGPAGVVAVWVNEKPVPAEVFVAMSFGPQGTVGLVLESGAAHFTPVMIRERN
jgi:hypothetical protein